MKSNFQVKLKSTFCSLILVGLTSCSVSSNTDQGAPAPAPEPAPSLHLDESTSLKGKTAPNPAATQPFTHSFISTYSYDALTDSSLIFKTQTLSHACVGGSQFEGPIVSITKPDGTTANGEATADSSMGMLQFKLNAVKGLNKINIQFNADTECNVQTDFSLKAIAPDADVNPDPTNLDKNLMSLWTKSEVSHSHKIVAQIKVAETGLWTSKVTLNDIAVYDVDFVVRTNTNVTPHQLELVAQKVRQASKDKPENPGDTYHCIYQILNMNTDKNLQMYCLAKGETFYPVGFSSSQDEYYYQGDQQTKPITDVATWTDQTNLALTIPDYSSAGVTVSFDVTDESVIGELSIYIALQHRLPQEVQAILITPFGFSINLTTDYLINGDNTIGRGGKTQEALANLKGKAAKGHWVLKFTDNRADDIGAIKAIRVLNYQSPAS